MPSQSYKTKYTEFAPDEIVRNIGLLGLTHSIVSEKRVPEGVDWKYNEKGSKFPITKLRAIKPKQNGEIMIYVSTHNPKNL